MASVAQPFRRESPQRVIGSLRRAVTRTEVGEIGRPSDQPGDG